MEGNFSNKKTQLVNIGNGGRCGKSNHMGANDGPTTSIPTTDKKNSMNILHTLVVPKWRKAKVCCNNNTPPLAIVTTSNNRTRANKAETNTQHYAARNRHHETQQQQHPATARGVTRHTHNIPQQHEMSSRNRRNSLSPQLRRKRSGEGVRQQRPHGRVDAPVQGQQKRVVLVLEGQSCAKHTHTHKARAGGSIKTDRQGVALRIRDRCDLLVFFDNIMIGHCNSHCTPQGILYCDRPQSKPSIMPGVRRLREINPQVQ